jgi:hypothetical protein
MCGQKRLFHALLLSLIYSTYALFADHFRPSPANLLRSFWAMSEMIYAKSAYVELSIYLADNQYDKSLSAFNFCAHSSRIFPPQRLCSEAAHPGNPRDTL